MRFMGKLKWVIISVVVLAGLGFGAVWIYTVVDKEDPKPTLSAQDEPTGTTSAGVASGDISGTWAPTSKSVFQYRVDETLAGLSNTATGQTNKVTGSMTVSGTTISAVDLTVDMASISSDRTQRDGQFRSRIMETSQFPTSTFKLSSPIPLDTVPGAGTVVTQQATGQLTLHGVTKTVTFQVKAQRTAAGTIEANGEIPIVFADYNIDDPSGGPAQTKDNGLLVFTVVFAK